MTAPIKQRVVEALNRAADDYSEMGNDERCDTLTALASELADKAIVPREPSEAQIAAGTDFIAQTIGMYPTGDRRFTKGLYCNMVGASDEQ